MTISLLNNSLLVVTIFSFCILNLSINLLNFKYLNKLYTSDLFHSCNFKSSIFSSIGAFLSIVPNCFDKNASSREMIVVIDRSFREYYFIVMDVSVFKEETKVNIYKFNICNDKVISKKVKCNGYFSFENLDDKSIIKRIKSLK